ETRGVHGQHGLVHVEERGALHPNTFTNLRLIFFCSPLANWIVSVAMSPCPDSAMISPMPNLVWLQWRPVSASSPPGSGAHSSCAKSSHSGSCEYSSNFAFAASARAARATAPRV